VQTAPLRSFEAAEASPAAQRFITGRLFLGLAAIVAAQALLVCWASDLLPGLPAPEMLSPESLPVALAGLAVALALLLAPLWEQTPSDGRRRWARAAFAGAWQALVLGYFLLLAGRGARLETFQLLSCAGIAGCTAMTAGLLAARFRRRYAGLIFLWAVAIPLGCYLLAEAYLATPDSGMNWTVSQAPRAVWLRDLTDWLLALSPGTAAVGALEGRSAGGAETGAKFVPAFLGIFGLLSAIFGWPRRPEGARGVQQTGASSVT
jgi:hypothetical protein